jgi:hypothetical protein
MRPQTTQEISRRELSDILQGLTNSTILAVEYRLHQHDTIVLVGFFERTTPQELVLCSHYQSLNALMYPEARKENNILLKDIQKVIVYDSDGNTPFYQIRYER